MKNSLCFPSFSNSSKPNRLIFQEQLPEGQKSLPKESTDSKEKIQENNTLAYQRTLVLENFRRRMFEKDTDFLGDDSNKLEKAKNEVLQYLYVKLDEFFKRQTSTEWPVNRQREWMDTVTNHIIDWVVERERIANGPIFKEQVDQFIPTITEGYAAGVYRTDWIPGLGTFPVWFSKKYPVEYHKIFGKNVEKD